MNKEDLIAQIEVLNNRIDQLEKLGVEKTAELRAANYNLESFTYSVSHDLKAPLRAISGFTDKLAKDYDTVFDEEGKRLLNIVLKSTENMGQLITDLLSISKVNRKNLVLSQISMNKLVLHVVKELEDSNIDRKLVITIKQLPEVIGDRSLVRQVIVNLLANSIRFTKPRETAIIEFGSFSKEHENIFYIKDNGVGFNMKYVHKIFDVFQRLHTSDEFEGTGAGLAIVQRIINRHGGKIWAEAEENKGATFYFSFAQ